MTFDEILSQVQDLLQREKRISYRGLKRRFALEDEYLEDLKEELIGAKRIAADEEGRFLVWTGDTIIPGDPLPVSSPTTSLPSPQSRAARPHTLDSRREAGERRQLTVQFIDLVGSTTLSQQLDPEDYHARVVAYQTACQQVIARYEGHIAQYLGDGVLVYFGYPGAHEDDAVRAVRSGLEIVAAVSQLPFTPLIQVRIGIHTGPVMVGEIGAGERTERLALGETPNIAARVQGIAKPDTVVVSAATYRLVEGLFECEDRGQVELKGVSIPQTLYRVFQTGEAQSRFQVVARKGLTPLIGREHEFGLLRERWQRVKDGSGQVVLLSGEPGIGKSRLVQELKERVSGEGAICVEFRCSPYHQNSALYPILDHLHRLLQFAREDAPAAKLEKLQRTLSHYHFPQPDTVPLLAALLALPHPEGYPPITVSPQKQKEKAQAALVAWLVEEAEQNTVCNIWEDLHWADPSTLEVLTLLLDQVPMARLLVMLTFRPEFMPSWGHRSHLSQLTLHRLGRPHVETMVENVTRGKSLPSEVLQQIVAKTDGVPLFVEELTKSVVETIGAYGRAPLQAIEIPSTLQDSLMARLDRLGAAKEIAQLGATLGREFDYALLQAVSPLHEEALQQELQQLVESELVYQSGVPPQARYLFKHALVQDTAYQSLLKSRRQQLHQTIGQVLEKQFPQTAETQPELVAHHYTEAGLVPQAIPYWQRAGERATQRSAYVEAVAHLTTGLEVLKTLPNTPERVQQELPLQLALYDALIAVKGYAAPESGQAVLRAEELCRHGDGISQLIPVLPRLVVFYMNRGEVQTALAPATQMLRLAQRIQDQNFLPLAHYVLGAILYWLGELVPAQSHLAQAIALYEPQQHPCPPAINMADPKTNFRNYASLTLWSLGYPDQALQRSQEAVTLAAELSQPFSLANVLVFAAWVHLNRREGHIAREQAEMVMTLSTEQGFPTFFAFGAILQGWALAEQGQGEEGIRQIYQGMDAMQATGTEVGKIYLTCLAEAHGRAGKIEQGLAIVAEALGVVDKTGRRFDEAELYRLKGELTLQRFNVQGSKFKVEDSLGSSVQSLESEAEECFLKAIKVAQRQQAKSLELRATMSLARLWQQQGKTKEAHQLLSEIYHWFTEGFDTKDLQEANALLEELH